MIKIKKGLDIPVFGNPSEEIDVSKKSRSVALLGSDYIGMKPTMLVKEGDQVKKGQPLFEDKKNPGVIFTSPAGGKVESVNRGLRRSLQSVVIEVAELEEEITFPKFNIEDFNSLDTETIREILVNSGLWTSFRTRPFSKIPAINSSPSNVFITATDSNPLSFNPMKYLAQEVESFKIGIQLLKNLSNKKVFVCVNEDFDIDLNLDDQCSLHTFSGPHPSGLVGTHMHYLSAPTLKNINWTINYQDVVAIAKLFQTGSINVDRLISLAGPQVNNPRIIKTRLGACTDEICAGELTHRENRVISGSIINGKEAMGPYAYLGRYHNQISVLSEPNSKDREFLNWLTPGPRKFSKIPIFISSLFPNKRFKFKTLMNGSDRAIVPIGIYEEVVPLNLLTSILLRYIAIDDTEKIQALGGLELDEEDLALCSFVCPSKYDFGSLLRHSLSRIEVEG
tara:strand:+ start:11252 stop:12604 length:1353 start_codon:yes stop_codon:yes gene_type:complete